MKVKRIVTISVFALFLLSVAVFVGFGPQIRSALSPEVKYVYPEMRDVGGRMMNALPSSAVWTAEDGLTYVWQISRSDEFPEPAFVVRACPIDVEAEQDGWVYFGIGYGRGGLSSSDAAAVEWEAELKDGMCVRPER